MAEMLEMIAFAVGFAAGIAVGRWWALIAAFLIGGWGAWEVPIESSEAPHWEVGVVAMLIAAAGVVVGLISRTHFASWRSAAQDEQR
jgi:hypothetical protein